MNTQIQDNINGFCSAMQEVDRRVTELNEKISNLKLQASQQEQNMILMQSIMPCYISAEPKNPIVSLYEAIFANDPIQKWAERELRQIDKKYGFIKIMKFKQSFADSYGDYK